MFDEQKSKEKEKELASVVGGVDHSERTKVKEQTQEKAEPGSKSSAEVLPTNDKGNIASAPASTKKEKGSVARILKPEEVETGMEIRVHQKITEGDKERVQVYEGVVLVRHGGKGPNATMTVRKISNGIGVEKIFPLHLPSITKIEWVRQLRIRQSRPLFLRTYRKKVKEV